MCSDASWRSASARSSGSKYRECRRCRRDDRIRPRRSSTPDGYTFGLGTVGTHAQGQTLYKKPLYNAATDFAPVALIARVPIVLITRKDLPVTDFKEYVTYAKANQSSMQYGSAGAGSATHPVVLLNYVIGVNITHVPYRGTGPAMQDLQGGRIDYLCEIITTAKPQIDGGSVKGIAIFDKQRPRRSPTCRPRPKREPKIFSPIPGMRSSCPKVRLKLS